MFHFCHSLWNVYRTGCVVLQCNHKDLHELVLSFRQLLLSSVFHTVIKFSTLTITASITTHMALRLYPWVADVISICHPINFPFKGNVMFGGKPTHTLVKAGSVVFTSHKCKHPFNFLGLIFNQKTSRDLRSTLHVFMIVAFFLSLSPARLFPIKEDGIILWLLFYTFQIFWAGSRLTVAQLKDGCLSAMAHETITTHLFLGSMSHIPIARSQPCSEFKILIGHYHQDQLKRKTIYLYGSAFCPLFPFTFLPGSRSLSSLVSSFFSIFSPSHGNLSVSLYLFRFMEHL